jgi:hypothetical protein
VKPVQFNNVERKPNRGRISDTDADILIAIGWAVLATPILVVGAVWKFLREGRE